MSSVDRAIKALTKAYDQLGKAQEKEERNADEAWQQAQDAEARRNHHLSLAQRAKRIRARIGDLVS